MAEFFDQPNPLPGDGEFGFRRGGGPFRGGALEIPPTRGGMPAVPITPVPIVPTRPVLTVVPNRPPVSFPTGPAANDPIFSQAGRLLRLGGIISAVATAADIAIRMGQEEAINREQREREEIDAQIARRLGSDNPLGTVTVTGDPDFSVPAPSSQPEIFPEINLPDVAIPPGQVPTPQPSPMPQPGGAPFPVQTPNTVPVPGPIAEPVPVSDPVPSADPESPFIPDLPGFGNPEIIPQFATPQPVGFPTFQPVGDLFTPRRLTELEPDPVTFGDVIELPVPEPVPQPDTAQRRCKPCKEDNPLPREQCFKGLYKEGRLDTEVDFTEWAEINCETGIEL